MLLYHQMSCDACMIRFVYTCVHHCVSYYIKGVLIKEVPRIHVYIHEHVPWQLECSFLTSSPFPCRDWCIWRTLSEGTEGHTAIWSSTPSSCVLTWNGRWAIVDLVHLSSIQRPHELPAGESSEEGMIQQWYIYCRGNRPSTHWSSLCMLCVVHVCLVCIVWFVGVRFLGSFQLLLG